MTDMDKAGGKARLEPDLKERVAFIVIDNPPVNASSQAVRRDLLLALARAADDPDMDAIVLIGAGQTFVAGSDIKEFGRPIPPPDLPAVVAAIEACGKPVVAAISGAALGGGYELALGCDARIAAADAIVGLPEATLGMIPGAGGTVRLPRLADAAVALEAIVEGRRIKAPEAARLGFIDRVAEGDLRAAAVAFARETRKSRTLDQPVKLGDAADFEAAAAKAAGGEARPAAREVVAALRRTLTLPAVEALALERETFQRLRQGEEAAALRHLFFAERQAGREAAGEAPRVSSIGVIGAGAMGVGIASACAAAGFRTLVLDSNADALRALGERLAAIDARALAKGLISQEEAEARRARIGVATDFGGAADADLVIEAVFEDMTTKSEVMARLGAISSPRAILASNTSYLDLNALAAASGRPERVVGMHFFRPAHIMRLIEIARGRETSPETLAAAVAVGRKLGKIPVVAGACEGFIGNRIYSAYRSHCEFMVEEGTTPEQVDAALTQFGFAMGPFAVWDLSGLDIAWRAREKLAASSSPGLRQAPYLNELVAAGRLGRKTGAGWYRYEDPDESGRPDPFVADMIEREARRAGRIRRALTAAEITQRALAAIVNEAALILEEGIAARASDIDVTLVHGYGFPKYRGGPLFWASRRDRSEIDEGVSCIAAAAGPTFRRGPIAEALARVAAEAAGR